MDYFVIFQYILVTIFALGWGSFATMAVYRLPNGEPWIGRRPFCTECGHLLKFIDYISLLSLPLYRGKCRYCQKTYGFVWVYFATEFLMLIYFLLNFIIHPFDEIFILNSGLVITGIIWSVIFLNNKKNIHQALLFLFFFASLKRTLLDGEIYDLIFIASFAFVYSLLFRHFFYFLKGGFKESKKYLEFRKENRFNDDDFIIVKLSVIFALLSTDLTLTAFTIFWAYLFDFIVKKTHLSLFLIMQGILVFSLF